jgi:3-hydroxymyristoyl/3-hydroxydecanoyl-(acyl carrier protein) dehydratase
MTGMPGGPRLLPNVLARRPDPEVCFTLRMDPDLLGFQGHFPGDPVLPGVVQVDWAVRFGTEAFGPMGAFRGLGQLKFHQVIRPERTLELHLALDRARGALRFSYQDGPDVLSAGVVQFEPQP